METRLFFKMFRPKQVVNMLSPSGGVPIDYKVKLSVVNLTRQMMT